MTTRKQAAANSTNAKKSTGPKTETGKGISRLNAVKHGFYSLQTTAVHEDPEHYGKLRESLVREFTPLGPTEHSIITDIVALRRDLDRLLNFECWKLNTAFVEDFQQSLGPVARTAEPDEITSLWQKFRQQPRYYGLDIDLQIKLTNRRGKIQKQLSDAYKLLKEFQARPIEERSCGAWMDPESPFAQSLAEHDAREFERNLAEEAAFGRMVAGIKLRKGTPAWSEDDNPLPTEDDRLENENVHPEADDPDAD